MKRSGMLILAVLVMLVVGVLSHAPQASAAMGGGKLFIRSAINLDVAAETVTLPLFKGIAPNGGDAWHIITDSSDPKDAEARGVNPAPKLVNALGTKAVQKVKPVNGVTTFVGSPDFGPTRVVVPSSPNGFPPTSPIPVRSVMLSTAR